MAEVKTQVTITTTIRCEILETELPSIDKVISENNFNDGRSGAVSVFAGLTRDNF